MTPDWARSVWGTVRSRTGRLLQRIRHARHPLVGLTKWVVIVAEGTAGFILLFAAVLTLVGTLVSDLLLGLIDPRIRLGGATTR